MPDIQALKNELTSDPESMGYSTGPFDDVADAAMLNDATLREINVTSLTAGAIFDELDLSEVIALDAGETTRLDRILSLGGDLPVQGNVRMDLLSLFGAGTNTRANLAAAIKTKVSRASELNFGTVRPGLIGEARRLP